MDEVQTWARNNGNLPVVFTSALTGDSVMDAFKQLGAQGAKQSMQGANVSMPSSLSGASGAIKLDAASAAAASDAQAKKKKKCGC